MHRSYAQAVGNSNGRTSYGSTSHSPASSRGSTSTSDSNTLTKSFRQFASNVISRASSARYSPIPSDDDPSLQGRERTTSVLSDSTETGDVINSASCPPSRVSTNSAHRTSRCSHYSHHKHSHFSQNSRYSQPRFSRYSDRSRPSNFSNYSRPSLIRRPTSTFVVGMEENPAGPTVLEMKTAVVQDALDRGGMGRYQWCMCVYLSILYTFLKITDCIGSVVDSFCVGLVTHLISCGLRP